jgi:hypothetical protein
MASTLTPTTFKIRIIEEQSVRNNLIKNEIIQNITNVSNIDHRFLTCPPSTSVNLINVNGPTPGAGTFPSSSLQYIRITNLDDTNSIAITISGSQGTFTQKLIAASTTFFSSADVTSSKFNGTFGDTIQTISAYAASSSVDIEYILINA